MSFRSKGVVHYADSCCVVENHRVCLRCFEQLPELPTGEVTKYVSSDGVEFFMLGHAAGATECEPKMYGYRPDGPIGKLIT